MIERYKALALQLSCHTVNSCKSRMESETKMKSNLNYILQSIHASRAFIGKDLKLIVLPEYILTGFPMGESITEWRDKASLRIDDPLIQELQGFCIQAGIHLAFNFYEVERHFPDYYFQTCVIFNDRGEKVLLYRRLNSMYTITPHDILTEYIEIYGEESLFPVADTTLGQLACIASEEILYPEVARCMMMGGAEVFLHSSSEVGSPLPTQKDIAKQARAIENMAFVISSNTSKLTGTVFPDSSADGGSRIIDPEGRILCLAGNGDSMVANAWIDVEALRDMRSKPAMSHFIARQRFELYSPTYQKNIYPVNNLGSIVPERNHFVEMQRQTIEKLKINGIIRSRN